MKQTVEEAARTHWSESTYNKDAELAYDERDCIAIKALAKAIALRAFKEGAAWQAKQFPWVSVEDKAGCDTSGDCIVMVMNGDIFKAYFSSENKWMKSNGGYWYEVIETYWFDFKGVWLFPFWKQPQSPMLTTCSFERLLLLSESVSMRLSDDTHR